MPEAPRSPEHLRVLVVDDHDVVQWGIRLMLTQQPWVERCLSASSGTEAVELAARYRPHVALVDLFIGEESGPQISQQLRERSPGTKVLLTSDYHMTRAYRAFKAVGIDVLPRPFPDVIKRANSFENRWGAFIDLARETVALGYYLARGWI